MRCFDSRLALPLLFAGLALPIAAQSPPVVDSPAEVGAVLRTIPVEAVDSRGRARAIEPEGLAIREDGRPRPIVELTEADALGGWKVVLYFDGETSSTDSLRAAAAALADEAANLTALGPVEVVVADPEPRVVLDANPEPVLVAAALTRLAFDVRGTDRVVALRRALLEDLPSDATDSAPDAGTRPDAGDSTERTAARIAAARGEERTVRSLGTDRLIFHLASGNRAQNTGGSPGALFLISDALFLPAGEFYGSLTGNGATDGAEPSTPTGGLDGEPVLARYLASAGWAAFPVAVDPSEVATSDQQSDVDRLRAEASPGERGEMVDVLGALRARRQARAAAAEREASAQVALRATSGVDGLARVTAGVVIDGKDRLDPLFERLAARRFLRYQGDPGHDPLPLQITGPAGRATLRAPGWSPTTSPPDLAAVRVRRLLDGAADPGELEILATLRDLEPEDVDAGDADATRRALLELRVDLQGLDATTRRALLDAAPRLTLGLVSEGGDGRIGRAGPDILQEQVTGAESEVGVWVHRQEIDLPEGLEWAAVVIEDLVTGSRGGGFAVLALPPRTPAVVAQQRPAVEEPAEEDEDSSSPDGFGDAVSVRLAELYVQVTDAAGTAVTGLGKDRFRLLDDGREQVIDAVYDPGELPITLGFAIDSSASMFAKLPKVARSARGLLDRLEGQQDRAFLVAFGGEARVEQGTTGELGRIRSALRRLEADGTTPLWASITVSLREIARSKGKRALVVLLDGADDDGRVPYKEALSLAERERIPIYLLIMNTAAAQTGGKGFRTRSFISKLQRLAETGGGALHYLETAADLDPIYQQIETELRSTYLVTYYPTENPGKVEIEVDGDELKVLRMGGR